MAVGIHPDDVEIGCGGTVALCVGRGDEVTIVDLTGGESSTNGTAAERAREAAEAARILGVARRDNAGLPDTGVRSGDPDQIRAVVSLIRAYRPEVILLPNEDDPHPDHAAGALLARQAMFLANVNGYRTGADGAPQARWRVRRALVYPGRREVRADVVVDVSAVYATKLESVRAHATQFGTREGTLPTPLNDPHFFDVIDARDRLAGRKIGVEHGEAFALLAPFALRDLGPLVEPEA